MMFYLLIYTFVVLDHFFYISLLLLLFYLICYSVLTKPLLQMLHISMGEQSTSTNVRSIVSLFYFVDFFLKHIFS